MQVFCLGHIEISVALVMAEAVASVAFKVSMEAILDFMLSAAVTCLVFSL